jgi:hypothetical protein
VCAGESTAFGHVRKRPTQDTGRWRPGLGGSDDHHVDRHGAEHTGQLAGIELDEEAAASAVDVDGVEREDRTLDVRRQLLEGAERDSVNATPWARRTRIAAVTAIGCSAQRGVDLRSNG